MVQDKGLMRHIRTCKRTLRVTDSSTVAPHTRPIASMIFISRLREKQSRNLMNISAKNGKTTKGKRPNLRPVFPNWQRNIGNVQEASSRRNIWSFGIRSSLSDCKTCIMGWNSIAGSTWLTFSMMRVKVRKIGWKRGCKCSSIKGIAAWVQGWYYPVFADFTLLVENWPNTFKTISGKQGLWITITI